MQNPTISTKRNGCELSRGEILSETVIRAALELCNACNYPNKFEDCTSFIDLNMQLSKITDASRQSC